MELPPKEYKKPSVYDLTQKVRSLVYGDSNRVTNFESIYTTRDIKEGVVVLRVPTLAEEFNSVAFLVSDQYSVSKIVNYKIDDSDNLMQIEECYSFSEEDGSATFTKICTEYDTADPYVPPVPIPGKKFHEPRLMNDNDFAELSKLLQQVEEYQPN